MFVCVCVLSMWLGVLQVKTNLADGVLHFY